MELKTKNQRRREIKALKEDVIKARWPQPIRIILSQMQGDQALEQKTVEVEDGTFFEEKVHILKDDETDEELSIPVTTIRTRTKIQAQLIFPGTIAKNSYFGSRYTMDIYEAYKNIAAGIFFIAMNMIYWYLIATPQDDVSLSLLWRDPWIMFFAGMILPSLWYLKIVKEGDTSLTVLPLTIQRTRKGKNNRMAYYCIPSSLPQQKVFALFGTDIPEKVVQRQTMLLESIFQHGAEQWLIEDSSRSDLEVDLHDLENWIRSEQTTDPQAFQLAKDKHATFRAVTLTSIACAFAGCMFYIYMYFGGF